MGQKLVLCSFFWSTQGKNRSYAGLSGIRTLIVTVEGAQADH